MKKTVIIHNFNVIGSWFIVYNVKKLYTVIYFYFFTDFSNIYIFYIIIIIKIRQIYLSNYRRLQIFRKKQYFYSILLPLHLTENLRFLLFLFTVYVSKHFVEIQT